MMAFLANMTNMLRLPPVPEWRGPSCGRWRPIGSPRHSIPEPAAVPTREQVPGIRVGTAARPVAVRILAFSDGLLRLGGNRLGRGPASEWEAVLQFTELMREAVGNRFLPPEIRFSGLVEYYATLVRDFHWPPISDTSLSILLVKHGGVRRIKRLRRGGIDKKYRVFQFPEVSAAMARAA